MQNVMNPKKETIVFGNDSIVIRKCVADIMGGRTLDCSGMGVAKDTLLAGHVVIKLANGNYAPMPIKAATESVAEGYDTLPTGASYVGVLKKSIMVSNPAASIVVDGIVNPELVPYKMDSILAAFSAACPHIIFAKDEEA